MLNLRIESFNILSAAVSSWCFVFCRLWLYRRLSDLWPLAKYSEPPNQRSKGKKSTGTISIGWVVVMVLNRATGFMWGGFFLTQQQIIVTKYTVYFFHSRPEHSLFAQHLVTVGFAPYLSVSTFASLTWLLNLSPGLHIGVIVSDFWIYCLYTCN